MCKENLVRIVALTPEKLKHTVSLKKKQSPATNNEKIPHENCSLKYKIKICMIKH